MIFHYNDIPVFYRVHGNGPAIVLLHGFLESSSMWNPYVPELSQSKTVVTIDLPGHGKSGCIETIHSMSLMAEVVYSIIKHLGIHVTSLIGHSMGGYVGLAYLEHYPDRVNSFMLLNSTSKADSAQVRQRRNRAASILATNKEAVIHTAVPNLFAESSRHLYGDEIDALKREALTFPSEGILAANLGMRDRKDRTEVLKVFSGNKYIVCAEEDPIVPLKISKEIAKVTHSELIILPGGHMSWIENPDEIVKIMRFIE